MFCCTQCGKNFSYIYLYLSHIRNFHRYDPNFVYVCGMSGCPIALNTFSAFKKHLYQHEEFKSRSTTKKLTCRACGFVSFFKRKFISHFKTHDTIECPVKNCQMKYTVYSSFTSHLARYHSCYALNDFKSEILTPSKKEASLQLSTPILPNGVENVIQNFGENFIQMSNYNRNVALFILKMKEICLLSHSTICELINGVFELQNDTISLTKQSIIEALKKNNVNDNTLRSVSNNFPMNNLSSVFDIMKSHHAQKKFLRENFDLIEPVQYMLKSNAQLSSYEYVPIIKTIQAFCKNNEVLDYVMSTPENTNINILSDIHDGIIFKNNPLFQTFPNIQILLYFDEFMVFNPLRGTQAKHKLAAFYFTLGNIPSKYRSSVKDMQLAILCKSSDLKCFGFHVVLEPLIKDLKILESDGITLSGIPCKVKGGLVSILGDNLASHQVGGFVTNFSGNSRCCRFCMAKEQDMQTNFTESKFVRRTKDMYNHHLSLVKMDEKYISLYGVKSDSPFNSLKYFHCSCMLPPDAMHDLLEGVVPVELGLIINHFILKKYVTLAQLNYKIKLSKFGFHDAANKPIEISKSFHKGIKMTAARMWCLLRFLPLLIGQKVPESEPAWCLLLMLKEIVDIVLAPKVNLLYVSYLSDLIRDHHKLFKEIFPTVKLKPKFHFLVHYPQLILEFGPLTNSWSMRFEAKHLYFKRVAQSIKNNINLPYSLANRHQQLQCYYNFEFLRPIGKSDSVTSGKPIITNNYSTEIAQLLTGYEEFYSLTKLELNGIIYKTGMCLVSGFHNDEPVFEKILIMLRKGTDTKFVCRTFESSAFFHLGGFRLGNPKGINILNLQNFVDVYPLSIYKYNNHSVVILKYMLFDPKE